MSSGPHQMNIGWLVFSRMRTAVRKLCGHASGGPSGLADQSYARVNAPISPPPARKSAELGLLIRNIRGDRWYFRSNYWRELSRLSQSPQTRGALFHSKNIFDWRNQMPAACARTAINHRTDACRQSWRREYRRPCYFMRP